MIGLFRKLLRARRGNVAIGFAILLPVLISAVGGAVDFAFVTSERSQLQDALDAASVGAVATNSAAYKAAAAMTVDGPVVLGVTNATSIFNANVANVSGLQNIQFSVSVLKSGVKITSTVSATGTYKTAFLGLAGISSMPIAVTSTSSNSTPSYLDFYLLLDVSGSMGLPSTNSEQTRLAAIDPDDKSEYPNGCTFACHFSGYQGYTLSRNGGNAANTPVSSCATAGTNACIQLRLDAVGAAVNQLIQTANSSEKVTNQYRIALYPFIAYLKTYFPLTASISGSASDPTSINYAAANLATLLDTGVDSTLGSGGTHFENALPSLNSAITSVGTGISTASTQPFVFLVTDGSQDNQYQWGGSWTGSNSATTLNTANCTTLKNRGIKISVLYIPYQPIQNPTTFSNSEDFYANANIPAIPASLQSCASPGFYFTANTPQDITNALTAMFNQAVAYDRITQ